MCLRIFFISVMHVVGSHQIDAKLLMHPQQLLIDLRLLRNAMILQLQEKISFPKQVSYFKAIAFASSYIPLVR